MDPRAELIIANRSYLDHHAPPEAGTAAASPEGGLLAALRPAIEPWTGSRGTTWIGAARGEHDAAYTDDRGYELLETPAGPLRHRRLWFDEATWRGHYILTANAFLWPLLHLVRLPLPKLTGYYPVPAAPDEASWAAFERVNRAFARAASEERTARTVWVHDYQLALVPRELRETGDRRPVGFFLHTSFPRLDVVRATCSDAAIEPLRAVVRGMLSASLIGFQTASDRERFHEAAAFLVGAVPEPGGLQFEGGRVQTGVFPVGINPADVASLEATAELPAEAADAAVSGLPLVAGLERCDFTKGIPERLRAIARVAEAGVRFAYVGIAAPTRPDVPGYAEISTAVREAGELAGAAMARSGGLFVQSYRAIPWPEVVALEREADVVFTSSLADGMNLVPLQSAIAQSLRAGRRRGCVLIGRDAGVAEAYAGFEADGFVPIDPLALDEAADALRSGLEGKLPGVSDRLIAAVRAADARSWASSFLAALERAC